VAEPRDNPEQQHPAERPPVDEPVLEAEDRETAYGLLQRGLALIKSRHHAQAAVVLERAAREEPGKGSILEPLGRAYHHRAHFALATSLRKLNRTAEARTHLRLAVALNPSSELYRRALARVDPPSSKPGAAA
jgi:Flp pilus assembly protein TadD